MSILAKGEYTVSPVSDGLVGSQGPAGADAYTVVLTNESHVFPGDVANALAGSTEVQVTALKGATQVAATIGTVTGQVTGLQTSIANNGTTSAKVTVTVTTQMATSGGTLTIPVTVDGKSFTKKFSFSIGYKGGVGKSVASITEYYLASASVSGVTTSTAGWTTTRQDLTLTNKYLWNYEKITYSNPSSTVNTTPVIIGIHGPQGIEGPGGVSVVSIDVWYYLSTSSSSLLGGSWSTSAPAWVNGRYMWSKTITTYSSGGPTESTPVCITGAAGSTGQVGTGVSSIIEEFYLSTSKVSRTGGSWLTAPPTWTPGMYMWTRSKITYTNPSSIVETEPMCDSSWEAVNEVKVGGRNLIIRKTLNRNAYLIDTGSTSASAWEWAYTDYIPITGGESFIISGYSTLGSNPATCFYDTGKVFVSGIKSRTSKFTTPAGVAYMRFSFTEADAIKLERGNKATDWTPAPEDVDAQIDNLNLELSSLSTGVGENNTSTQGAITAIQDMIATLEAQKSALEGQVAALEQAKTKTDNYIQLGTVKLPNDTTVFGVVVGKDVNVLNPDGTISTFERSMTATTANGFMILTGGGRVFNVDATGADAESFRGKSIAIDGSWVQTTTPTKGFVLKWGG